MRWTRNVQVDPLEGIKGKQAGSQTGELLASGIY